MELLEKWFMVKSTQKKNTQKERFREKQMFLLKNFNVVFIHLWTMF